MKIIKRGSIEDSPKTAKCPNCGSILEYTSKDFQIDRDGRYIECPVCKENGKTQFITV